MSRKDSGLVYSSESGKMCSNCERPVEQCICKPSKEAESKLYKGRRDGNVRVARETKGRKGKGVTIITGLPLTMDQLKDLAKELKQKCGTGGTVKDGVIEIQGEHRDALVKELTERGFNAKKSGG